MVVVMLYIFTRLSCIDTQSDIQKLIIVALGADRQTGKLASLINENLMSKVKSPQKIRVGLH